MPRFCPSALSRPFALTLPLVLSLVALPAPAWAEEAPKQAADKGSAGPEAKDERSTTEGKVDIGGKTVRYEATAGLMVLRDDEGKAKATFGYTAYVKTKVADRSKRPILFAYNGGPGSASIWLHMGILGPRRVVLDDPGHTGPAPYRAVDNALSVLDVADLVMMDPVGTGYARTLGETKGEKTYWGVDQDAAAAAEFISLYLSRASRWRSPKYVLGESYGGMRTGAVAYRLMTAHNIDLNGIILVSPFMDMIAGMDGVRNDLPHTLFLSTMAATAFYHDLLEPKPKNLASFLAEVDAFAASDYLLALRKGNRLPEGDKDAMASRLARYTGVDKTYWLRANLRVRHGQFLQEVQRRTGLVTGRIDSRFEGPALDPISDSQDYDPYFSKVRAAYTATFLDYMHNQLGFGRDKTYKISAGLWRSWDWSHASPVSQGFKPPFANTAVDLEATMKQNPTMRVLVQQGYFDLATPYGATDYFVDHLNISPEARERITIEYYEAGHMMYVYPKAMTKFAEDLRAFIRGR